jgi:hypothetical protein
MMTVPLTTTNMTTRLNDDDDDNNNNNNNNNSNNKKEQEGDVDDGSAAFADVEANGNSNRMNGSGSSNKLTFSLAISSTKKKMGTATGTGTSISTTTTRNNDTIGNISSGSRDRSTVPAPIAHAFGDDDEDDRHHHHNVNPDIDRPVLVIPLQTDKRVSLQEQAKAKRMDSTAQEKGYDQSTSSSLPLVIQSMEMNMGGVVVDHTNATGAIKEEEQEEGQQQPHHRPLLSLADQDAVDALTKDAMAATVDRKTNPNTDGFGGRTKLVIQSNSNTFQMDGTTIPATISSGGGEQNKNSNKYLEETTTSTNENQVFQEELEHLPADIPVESYTYKAIPISEFGAAMLRGMGWTGDNNTNNNYSKKGVKDLTTVLPRPSRLGLGAIPKMDIGSNTTMPATHGNGSSNGTSTRQRPRRMDQFQREERLKQQQEEFERERQRQIAMDKQQTIQNGSIVSVQEEEDEEKHDRYGTSSTTTQHSRRRAMIQQLQGVPGLNMILVQLEGEDGPTKVKKGSVTLIERSELHERPYNNDVILRPPPDKYAVVGPSKGRDTQKVSSSSSSKIRPQYNDEEDDRRSNNNNNKRRDERRGATTTSSSSRSFAVDHKDADRKSSRRSSSSRQKEKDDRGSRNSNDRHRDTDCDDRDYEKDHRNKKRDYPRGGGHHKEDDDDGNYDNEKRKRQKSRSDKHDDDHDDDNFRPSNKSSSKRKHSAKSVPSTTPRTIPSTWLIPNIRVRVISSKYGDSLYKQKGVVVDVTREGIATLTIQQHSDDGRHHRHHHHSAAIVDQAATILHAPERHLETALPKVGGNVIILNGIHRWAKGRLLERDSRGNKGVVQVYEDMNVVTTSLDDMAEWCGPLDDDDDMDHHF